MGPFEKIEGFKYPEIPAWHAGRGYGFVLPAPLYHDGAWYLTEQGTQTVWTTPRLVAGAQWAVFANISHANLTAGVIPEDPFLYTDHRNNWHIVTHSYDTAQIKDCQNSALCSHFFSTDGQDWHLISGTQPYSHTVHYEDGTNHSYSTLEQVSIHFDTTTGQMTHMAFAADLVTASGGCASRPWRSAGPTACTNCKYNDHGGTVVVKLRTNEARNE